MWVEMTEKAYADVEKAQKSFNIMFLSTKTIKSSAALMYCAALQVKRERVSLS